MNIGINNRPGWGYGGGRPGWGYGGGHGHWADHWRDHHVHYHHNNWYHGCWSGNWGNSWYVPLVYGATAWGVSAALPSWGYNYSYSYTNPYYASSAMPAYDYSQPIVINTYNSPAAEASADGGTAAPPEPANSGDEEAYRFFDNARSAFKRGDYRTALSLDEQAVAQVPSDPMLHEFGALCLFASGAYDRAAAVLNSLLAVAPGMDWTTMSSLYGDVDSYTKQLRALESHVKQRPDDLGARFVLAYHYLVAGHTDDAVDELQYVVAKQPSDVVARRMYDALKPAEVAEAETAPPPAAGDTSPATESTAETTKESTPEGSTDLVGNWTAEREGSTFRLTITEDGKFVWKAVPKGQTEITIAGQTATTSDTLVLESAEQGSMVARVVSGGPDEFQFVTTDSPPGDPGLQFKRIADGD